MADVMSEVIPGMNQTSTGPQTQINPGQLLQLILGAAKQAGNPASPNQQAQQPGAASTIPGTMGPSAGPSGLGPMVAPVRSLPGANVPLVPKQYPEHTRGVPQGEFATRGGHTRTAIGNIFGDMAQAVKGAAKEHEMKEARSLAVDIERLAAAMQNPDDPQNKQIINDILSDKKKQKKISEALGINYMEMEDKRSPETKAAMQIATGNIKKQQAQKQAAQQPVQAASPAQAGGPATSMPGAGQPQASPADRFLSKLPVGVGMSPTYQVYAQLVKDGIIPTADQALKSDTDMKKEIMSNETKERIADKIAQTQNLKSAQALVTAYAKIAGAKEAASLMAKSREKVANIQGQARIKAAEMIHSGANQLAKNANEATQKKINILKERNVTAKNRITELQKEYKAEDEKWWSDGDKLKKILTEYESVKQEQISITNELKALQGTIGAGTSAGSGTNSNTGDGANGTDDFNPEEVYNSIVGDDEE